MRKTALSFGLNGDAEPCCLYGFHPPEVGFTWSNSSSCAVTMTSPSNDQCVLVIHARPYVCPPALNTARIRVAVNQTQIGKILVLQDFVACLPLPISLQGSPVNIEIIADDAASPSGFGQEDQRTLGVALIAIAIVDYSSAMNEILSVLGGIQNTTDQEIARWAAIEMLPWAALGINRTKTSQTYGALNQAGWCQVFRLEGKRVTAKLKPLNAGYNEAILERASSYERFFNEVASNLPESFSLDICVCLADQLHTHFDVPIFVFQKPLFSASINIPDPELLQNDYFEHQRFSDTLPYEMKAVRAVFSGSTTGGWISKEIAKSGGLPRLDTAKFFEHSRLVDFWLPNVVQCVDADAEAELRSYSFCRHRYLTWSEQFTSRFLISLDGNGAACSRVAVALKSNCAMLKYESPNQLYYFHGLLDSVHYVPISQDSDILRVVAMEISCPGLFGTVARAGTAFCADYLNREKVVLYASIIIRLYEYFQA